MYGPAEATIVSTYYITDFKSLGKSVPIGRPFPNYHCKVVDEFLQSVVINQEGELFVGGVGVFAGYLGRDDLTKKALVQIENETFYRTHDVVSIDGNGLLHYLGRKDHQIKLHGQRIELGEIERCLLNTSISACIVIKWTGDQLVAYVQSTDIDEKKLREHCQFHLPTHMVPSIFVVLEKLPLNANGKIDRKLLPTPQLSTLSDSDHTDAMPLTKLEEHLQRIFGDAFHNKSPNLNMSFGEMGGTSLDVIRALWLIRQEICTKVDIGLLFANPSIRQLARAIEPLLVTQDDSSVITITLKLKEEHDRPMPSLYIELLGILLLICHWILPIWLAYQFDSLFTLLFMPAFHLLSYVVCQRLLFRSEEIVSKVDRLYSSHYYRWWFLNSMWSVNNSYWLKHLLGTPFYNYYLRLCGAKIGYHSHIYTTLIDAPWLIEVGEFTFVGEEVVLSNLSYQDQTYELHRIQIGSYCSINIRSVLYENVVIEDYVHIEPMSAITGHIPSSNHHISIKDRLLLFRQTMYQFSCLLILFFIHILLLLLAYDVYSCCSTLLLPLPISLSLSWLIWTLACLVFVVFLLKYIVRPATSGHYSINSYHYLHKVWLRQLIVTSFGSSLDSIQAYDVLGSVILRWLDAHIEDDVKFGKLQQILYFPTNLLNAESGVTTFGGVILAPFEVNQNGLCCLDEIHLSTGTNLGNGCTIMPGSRLSSKTMVGSFTLVTQGTVSSDMNRVLFGIPAREMPFVMPDATAPVNDLSSSSNSLSIHTLLITCLRFFISKCLFITPYLSLPVVISPFIYVFLFCAVYRYLISARKTRTQFTFSEIINLYRSQPFFGLWKTDFSVLVAPYLSGTQFLVFLFRALGAQIGSDVILPGISCLADCYLVTIGDHVRLNRAAYIQVIYL
jgi:acetyltransferase-like isoleucine patch superfamily enzyme